MYMYLYGRQKYIRADRPSSNRGGERYNLSVIWTRLIRSQVMSDVQSVVNKFLAGKKNLSATMYSLQIQPSLLAPN